MNIAEAPSIPPVASNAVVADAPPPGLLRPRHASRRRWPRGALAAGGGLVFLLLLGSLLVGVISPYTPTGISPDRFAGMTSSHWLGTDSLGRDTFTRVFVAARVSLVVSLFTASLAAVIGTTLGVLAGFRGGRFDQVAMRVVDTMLALPPILVALVIRVVWGPGIAPLVLGMGIIFAPYFARVMRAPVLSLRERDFVVAAEVAGVRRLRIAMRHLLPNAMTPLLVQFAGTASIAVLLEASLSYLGQGIPPPSPSAGRMINEAQRYMESNPLLILAPAVLVTLMTIAWNLIADGLQASLAPRRSHLHSRVERVAVSEFDPIDQPHQQEAPR